MEKKIYLKLYIYAFIILITSMILTSIVLTFHFHQFNEKRLWTNPFILPHVKLSQICLNDSFNNGLDNFKTRMKEVKDLMRCSISYWKDNKLVYYLGIKPSNVSTEQIMELKIYLNDKNVNNGFLVFDFDKERKNKPPNFMFLRFLGIPNGPPPPHGDFSPMELPLSPISFIFFFLALLLIPYSLYVLKPFKNIMSSINKIAQGDLTYPVQISKKNEFKELAVAFERMQNKIKEMINQKQELIADVSHELRSPLTRIRICLELLTQKPEGGEEYIQQAISEIKDLDSLIDDLLGISRLELATSKLNLESIDLKNILTEQIAKNQILLNKSKITLKQDLPEESVYINADKELLKRVFNNLFSNLLQYAPYGSIVDVLIKKTDVKISLSIRNRGPSIEKDEYEKIFEPFYRTDKSRARKTGGTGLGLAITKKILQSHNGKIWVTAPDDNEGGVIFNLQFNRGI